MSFVYIVIENGETYPSAYQTYAAALKAVHDLWEDEVQRQRDEGGTCSEIYLLESPSGNTSLYVEKGININIIRLQVLQK